MKAVDTVSLKQSLHFTSVTLYTPRLSSCLSTHYSTDFLSSLHSLHPMFFWGLHSSFFWSRSAYTLLSDFYLLPWLQISAMCWKLCGPDLLLRSFSEVQTVCLSGSLHTQAHWPTNSTLSKQSTQFSMPKLLLSVFLLSEWHHLVITSVKAQELSWILALLSFSFCIHSLNKFWCNTLPTFTPECAQLHTDMHACFQNGEVVTLPLGLGKNFPFWECCLYGWAKNSAPPGLNLDTIFSLRNECASCICLPLCSLIAS